MLLYQHRMKHSCLHYHRRMRLVLFIRLKYFLNVTKSIETASWKCNLSQMIENWSFLGKNCVDAFCLRFSLILSRIFFIAQRCCKHYMYCLTQNVTKIGSEKLSLNNDLRLLIHLAAILPRRLSRITFIIQKWKNKE